MNQSSSLVNMEVIRPYAIFVIVILVSTVPSTLATRSDSYMVVWLCNSLTLMLSMAGSLYSYHYLMLITHKDIYKREPQKEPFFNNNSNNDVTVDPPGSDESIGTGTLIWD